MRRGDIEGVLAGRNGNVRHDSNAFIEFSASILVIGCRHSDFDTAAWKNQEPLVAELKYAVGVFSHVEEVWLVPQGLNRAFSRGPSLIVHEDVDGTVKA